MRAHEPVAVKEGKVAAKSLLRRECRASTSARCEAGKKPTRVFSRLCVTRRATHLCQGDRQRVCGRFGIETEQDGYCRGSTERCGEVSRPDAAIEDFGASHGLREADHALVAGRHRTAQ